MGDFKSKTIVLFSLAFAFFVFAQNANAFSAIDYAPNFWFDSEEKYYPANPLDFYYDANFNEIPGQIAKQKYDNLSLGQKINNITVFYEIRETEKEIVYQYWLFYVFNNFIINDHYGDFESVFVFVDKQSKKINRIIASAHHGSESKIILANNELNNPRINHVTILVEKGSHANCPDGNNNGLFEKTEDITNWYNAYAFMGFKSWSQEDKLYGFKINYTDLNLQPLASIKIKDRLISQSPTLGSLPVTIAGEKIYLLPIIGGAPGQDPWHKSVYYNPEEIRPITPEFVVEKVKEFAENAKEKIVEIFQKQPKEAMIGQSLMPAITSPQESNNQETITNDQAIVNLPITNNQTTKEPKPKLETKPETKITQSQPKIQKPEPESKTETASKPKAQQAPAFFPIGGPKPLPEPEPDLCQETTCNDQCYDNNVWFCVCDPNTGDCILDTLKASCGHGCSDGFCLPEPEPEPIPPDITPPTKPILTSPQAENNFILTNASTTRLLGLVSADTNQVLIFANNATTTINPIEQEWQFDLTLENATTSLRIFAQDEADNQSESLNLEIAYDNLAPALNVIINQSNSETPGFVELVISIVNVSSEFYRSDLQAMEIQYKKDGEAWQIWKKITGYEFETLLPETTFPDIYFAFPPKYGAYLYFQAERGYNYQFRVIVDDKANNITQWQYAQEIYFAPVIINEIAWMGTTVSANYEWIELYNNASSTIALVGWKLEAKDGRPKIALTGTIEPNGYFLLEHMNDTAVPGIPADQIYPYDNRMENEGEILCLRNKQGLLIDFLDFGSGWPAGNNTTKRTMERTQDGSWQTSPVIGGTPKALNSQ